MPYIIWDQANSVEKFEWRIQQRNLMHNIAKVQPVDVAENFYAVLEEASIFRWALKNLGIAFDSAKSFL
jgi:hypothetical protein